MGLVSVEYGFSTGSKKQTRGQEQKPMFFKKICKTGGLETNQVFLGLLV